MTEEQIKQNAERYAIGRAKLLCPMDAKSIHTLHGTKEDYKEVFLAGAHSRDEEFALLKAEIEDDNAVMKQLKAELAKAKNPWVSVNERLPKKMPKLDYSEVVLVRNKNGEVGKARYCHQGYMAPRWEHWLYGSGIPSPDYWMPIPPLKGGEK